MMTESEQTKTNAHRIFHICSGVLLVVLSYSPHSFLLGTSPQSRRINTSVSPPMLVVAPVSPFNPRRSSRRVSGIQGLTYFPPIQYTPHYNLIRIGDWILTNTFAPDVLSSHELYLPLTPSRCQGRKIKPSLPEKNTDYAGIRTCILLI